MKRNRLLTGWFIERDLFHATSLSQMRWSIIGNKPTKTQIVNFLSSVNGRAALGNIDALKYRQFFPLEAQQINAVNKVDFFISKINNDAIFQSIFK